ncbi:hypothetical protein QVD17_14004 [Tagetes erecta]|uniref:Enhancer of mRNA-decapping protein 4 C-terminal domain-containing protein n=1 Tax=Tagetes erecta TaxID=13708 RepID=A0AAD8L433_TARER|nr:hypothetical protein QVD17_14004 [Tagetes erecta]
MVEVSGAVNARNIVSCWVDMRGVADKSVHQLEKLINSKLEASVSKQIQTHSAAVALRRHQTLSGELAEGQRKLASLAVAGANSESVLILILVKQVDLQGLLTSNPLPLSQYVLLLSLLQQLACDIGNDTSNKLGHLGA